MVMTKTISQIIPRQVGKNQMEDYISILKEAHEQLRSRGDSIAVSGLMTNNNKSIIIINNDQIKNMCLAILINSSK